MCRENNLKYHLDGARVFNAIVKNSETALQYGKTFDSISICLSKGLGAPVGSLLIGNKDFVRQSRRVRKVMGGGMRQGGYLAAAGIHALDHHIGRLAEDHRRAKEIAAMVERLPFVHEILPVETNIVVFRLEDTMRSEVFMKQLAEKNVFAVGFGKQTIRMVTHLDFGDAHLEEFEKIIRATF